VSERERSEKIFERVIPDRGGVVRRRLTAHRVQLESASAAAGREGGERDFWVAFSTRDRRRAAGMGLTSVTGECPDLFAQVLEESGILPFGLDSSQADACCAWWLRACLDAQADDGAPWEELERPDPDVSELPRWAQAWIAGLTWERKRQYATDLVHHVFAGGPEPVTPVDSDGNVFGWVRKVDGKVARRLAAEIARG
jgi:hypothetical protein